MSLYIAEFAFILQFEILCNNGRPSDRLTEAEFNQSLEGAPVNGGKVDIAGFTVSSRTEKSNKNLYPFFSQIYPYHGFFQ